MDGKLYAQPKLKEVREAKGLTQSEMADLLEMLTSKSVSPSMYQKWEQGTHGIDPDFAIKISKVLKVQLNELWTAK